MMPKTPEEMAEILRNEGMSDKEQAMFSIVCRMTKHKITVPDLVAFIKGEERK